MPRVVGRIFETWVDGFGSSNNGSQVGYPQAPFTERTITHGGKQAMPLNYGNTGVTAISEATRTFAAPQDWTASGIKSLLLYFQGAAGNSGQLYLKINNAKVPYSGTAGDIAKPAWILWNVDLSTVGEREQRNQADDRVEGACTRASCTSTTSGSTPSRDSLAEG